MSEFDDDTEDYEPSWEEVQRWVKDRAAENSRAWTDEWLETHPLDWLMAVRYLKARVEDSMALAKAHKRLHLDEHGQDVNATPQIQREAAKTRLRRIALRNALDDQLNHAKYLLGNDRVTSDTVCDILQALTYIRALLIDESHDIEDATRALDSLMRNLASRTPIEPLDEQNTEDDLAADG